MSVPTGVLTSAKATPEAATTSSSDDYSDYLKKDLGETIDALKLEPLQDRFLRSRWLDQVLWMEKQANGARRWYFVLRLVVILGGVMLPALVGLKLSGSVADTIYWLTWTISLLVAGSAAIEEFFHLGERWRHYRRTAEMLKIEGWQFFSLAGPYGGYRTHGEAFATFAARVEGVIQPSVEVYITDVAREKEAVASPKDGRTQQSATVSPERVRSAGTPADSL
jgi:hypothetical protein